MDIRTLGAPLGPQKPLFFRTRNFEKLAFSPKGQIVKKLYVFTAAPTETTFGGPRAHLGTQKLTCFTLFWPPFSKPTFSQKNTLPPTIALIIATITVAYRIST